MKKTSQNPAQFSPYIGSPVGYVRPDLPMKTVPSQNQYQNVRPNVPMKAVPSQNLYQMMRTLETSADQLVQQQKNIQKQFKSDALDKLAKEDYQPAKYDKAVIYRNQRSYMKKIDNQYKQLDLFCDTEELRYFGLGTYFYIEFYRRMMWLFFVLALINGLSIYINFQGNGLSSYSVSFSSYLIQTTLGNYSGPVFTSYDVYAIIFAPALSFLALLIFYWIWKCQFYSAIRQQEQDNKDVKPQKFCLQIVGLPQEYVREDELIKFFTSFGPVYEVSLARNYDNKLPYFEEMDQLNQQIKEQELELILDGDQSNRKSIQQKKQKVLKLQEKLSGISIKPYTVSAFVHYQFQKSKLQCLNYFNEHYLHQNCCYSCIRSTCCCCIKSPDQKVKFNGNVLLVSKQHPPRPEDINWLSFQIGLCNKLFRIIISCLIIIVFLAISCTIIGLCSIYIETHSSNCDGIDTSTYSPTTITAAGSTAIIRCYCNSKLVESFSDSSIQAACGDYLKDIYIEQSIQYAVIITSSVTNILFGLISDRLVNFIRPSSLSATLKYKTAILTIFFTLNSILIPVLIYANIFGFTPSKYVSFLTIFSNDIRNFFKVDTLSFYPNFTAIWYRNVSPVFTNYVLFNIISLWVSFVFFKCCCSSKDSLKSKQNRILQKSMNTKITDFKLQVQKEAANLYLIIIMASIFWSGIPAIVPLAFLNILSRYIINRSLLQNSSTRIAGLGEQFSTFTLVLLPLILILCPVIGEWMLVANSKIFPIGIPANFTLSFLVGYLSQLDMQMYLPFYMIISALALAQYLIYYLVIRFCSNLCSLCGQKKQIQFHSRPFAQYTKSLNVLCSYNIRNNDNLRNVILNLQKYLIKYDSK